MARIRRGRALAAAAAAVAVGGVVLVGVVRDGGDGEDPATGPTAVPTADATAGAATGGTVRYPIGPSRDGRSLVDADGDPYLYLADTVWLAPSRLDEAGMERLLDVRARQGFTTLQVSALPFVHLPGGLTNTYGDAPVRGTDLAEPLEVGVRTGDPDHPDHDYWDHLDTLFTLAAERGMQLTVVPAWYGYQGEDWRGYVDVDSARAYGRFLGERLGHHRNLVWLLGGDNTPVRDVDKVPDGGRREDVVEATRAMAEAIRATESVPHLMSYHAERGVDSVERFADDDWHTFASAYSDALTWRNVEESSGTGVPVVLTEAFYDGREQHTVPDRRELRAQGWWAVLGGAGFAYGHEDVWDLDPGHGPESDGGAATWHDALTAPSAADMTVLARAVAELVPLRPTDDVVVGDRGGDDERISAAVSADGRAALVYLPRARTIRVSLDVLDADAVALSWLDPATGERREAGTLDAGGAVEVTPPGADEDADDAVLVLRAR